MRAATVRSELHAEHGKAFSRDLEWGSRQIAAGIAPVRTSCSTTIQQAMVSARQSSKNSNHWRSTVTGHRLQRYTSGGLCRNRGKAMVTNESRNWRKLLRQFRLHHARHRRHPYRQRRAAGPGRGVSTRPTIRSMPPRARQVAVFPGRCGLPAGSGLARAAT